MADPSPSELLRAHDKLASAFALHQEALLLGDLEAAQQMLDAHDALLALHMRHEEELVLPIFERAGAIKKWPRSLYTGQHEKMRAALARVRAGLQQLTELEGRERRLGTLALLDLESVYKHLVEHHDGAEREGLFPVVDQHCAGQDFAALIGAAREWQLAEDEARVVFERIVTRLEVRASRLP